METGSGARRDDTAVVRGFEWCSWTDRQGSASEFFGLSGSLGRSDAPVQSAGSHSPSRCRLPGHRGDPRVVWQRGPRYGASRT
jgi:hypothetical protein